MNEQKLNRRETIARYKAELKSWATSRGVCIRGLNLVRLKK
jgi:hypothetical protein